MLMQETLHDHQTSISVGVRCICNLRFADDVDLMGGSSGELQDLTKTNGQRLNETASFKCLGAALCEEGTCSAEIRIRIA